jgi:LPXTG-site transpeptidase (sortase) family protein
MQIPRGLMPLFRRRTWRRRLYQARTHLAQAAATIWARTAAARTKIAPAIRPKAAALGNRLRTAPKPALAAGAVAVLALVAVVVLPQLHKPRPAGRPSAPVTVSAEHPSEAAIAKDTYRSTAVGAEPKYLRLPSLKAEGFVEKVGIDQHRQVAVPTNIHLAGWFSSSVTPGELGLSIIDGHLDGSRQPGIFAHLDRLKSGDQFSVELANGKTRTFLVKSVQSLSVDKTAAVLFSQIPGISRQLNLITCGGTFTKSAGYDHRVVVSASLK